MIIHDCPYCKEPIGVFLEGLSHNEDGIRLSRPIACTECGKVYWPERFKVSAVNHFCGKPCARKFWYKHDPRLKANGGKGGRPRSRRPDPVGGGTL